MENKSGSNEITIFEHIIADFFHKVIDTLEDPRSSTMTHRSQVTEESCTVFFKKWIFLKNFREYFLVPNLF
jgi:hypothetical protein